MDNDKISFSFINPPFENNKKLFLNFINKNEIVRGLDGKYHMQKNKKDYFNFLKDLNKFLKDNNCYFYKKVYGTILKKRGKIVFETYTD